MNNVDTCFKVSAPLLTIRLFHSALLLVTLGLAGGATHAAESVTLAWDPSPDPTVVGYYLHYGTASHVYSGLIDSRGATSATVEGLLAGHTYFFAVTAYNQERIESAPSGEIAYTVPDKIPTPVAGRLRILRGTGVGSLPRLQFLVPPTYQYEIQASEDMKSWKTIHRSASLSTNWTEYVDPQAARLPKRFYRLGLPDAPRVPGVISLVRGAIPRGAICLRPEVTPGQRYQIQASQDLVSWTTIHEGICASTQPMDFVDAHAGSFQKRFYRLALPDNPLLPSAVSILRGGITNGSRLRVATLEGQHYRIEASQDMVTWTTIYEGIGHSTEPAELIDPDAGFYPKRFYRLAFD